MLDLFSIFNKGGIVFWCFQSKSDIFSPAVNALIRSVILEERSGNTTFNYSTLKLQYKLDNEFELVFVVAYQRILHLSYIDKFLNDIHLEFRDKYKNELTGGQNFLDYKFKSCFENVLQNCEHWSKCKAQLPKQMRTFEETEKSKKSVASMIQDKVYNKSKKAVKIVELNYLTEEEEPRDDAIFSKKAKLFQKKSTKKKEAIKSLNSLKVNNENNKRPRVWDLTGDSRDLPKLDFSNNEPSEADIKFTPDIQLIDQMQGNIRDLEVESEVSRSEEVDVQPGQQNPKKSAGIFSIFNDLLGQKALTKDSITPVLDKMRDHLMAKNVAAEIAKKLCVSVGKRLEGKILGTFDKVADIVKLTITESLVQILSPKRRVDILRSCIEAKTEGRPYVISFCGVNGVGKSTNLAKICFWLIENDMSVLIAACDTFRAGAIEQLRTHTRHLNALHPESRHGRMMVQLYEKGYGKNAANIAMEAIRYANKDKIDVVLIDTAGRMQNNEPLMRTLAQLINGNQPDLVLFLGEALVGNEAVNQLVKFNQALADCSSTPNPRGIDGIVLTKFDTIDDKVGAAVSMTYVTGQPIVFVGTGQTYSDLKAFNVKAVVHALMK